MTSREKAIEALREVSGIVSNPEHDSLIADIAHELCKPTLDDAIAVVESMKKSLPTLTSREEINVYKRVLTALKGLKGEGK